MGTSKLRVPNQEMFPIPTRVRWRIEELLDRRGKERKTKPLTLREKEILRRLMYGHKEIAKTMGLSCSSISKNDLKRISRKLGFGLSDKLDQLKVLLVGIRERKIEFIPFPAEAKAEAEAEAEGKSLSSREKEILRYVSQGYTHREIAEETSLKLHTVKNHLHNIFIKLEVENRVQAALVWLWMGLESVTKPEKSERKFLSPREEEILLQVAYGFSNEEISKIMFISITTVKAHLRSIFKILKARNRAHAVFIWEQTQFKKEGK